MTIKRKKQLNITTDNMSDEVYKRLSSLSDKRKLTHQVSKWAEQDISLEDYKKCFEQQVYKEITGLKTIVKDLTQEIRRIATAGFLHEKVINNQPEKSDDSIDRISNDICYGVIDDEESDYGY